MASELFLHCSSWHLTLLQVCGRDEFFAVEVAASARCEVTVSIIVYEFALQQLQFTALAQLLLITPVSNDNDIGRQTVLAFYPA